MSVDHRHTLDVAVIGGGIIGVSTALALLRRHPCALAVFEAETQLAAHQTGHNSGVIHSGIYYRPGSLKAELCREGREALYRFCEKHGVPHERCGKVIVASDPSELPMLDELHRRARLNGLHTVRRCSPAELREREPHVAGIAGLAVEDTGIVDYSRVTAELAAAIPRHGGAIRLGARILRIVQVHDGFVLQTALGEFRCRNLLNCAGLESDRMARMCGVEPGVQIVPFRGEYYRLRPTRQHLVRDLIYPVPVPAMPFLGVHFTRGVDGTIEAGPNAVLALARRGYTRATVSPRDIAELASYRGFWRMAQRHWRVGAYELYRSFSPRAFLRSLQRLVPAVALEDLEPGGAGVRAQAVDRDGALVEDFRLIEYRRMLHVVNAPSPAATASLAIARVLSEKALGLFEIPSRLLIPNPGLPSQG